MSPPALAVEHGVVAYSGRPVLRDVTLRIGAGEVVALLGANGSGKSTLVRAALGLVPLAAGTARLFDRPVHAFRQWARVGYVPQRMGAGSGVPATVREVVASGRLARRGLLRLPTRQDRSAVAAALETVGLTDRVRDPVGTLSGGQQQRVLVARALASEPELLVLDEPNSGVDAGSQNALAAALGQLAGRGVAVALVAHELGPLDTLVGRAVVLQAGRVVHDGPVPRSTGAPLPLPHAHQDGWTTPASAWARL